ncbi:50S ribosomal protein L25/general stress protein Ctc [Marichromatium gracile]|uniref:Large ribosomal subunit protein bL25 n=1 Tax=Marichromatium gracile TaxID=1048 RepID=A0A4R4A732_MARGR|nr:MULTISPECIES: 50S ribosomal protein L25/general stress protein Ctc [Marichromatium]MBO8084710.1 50S ribosomal protein L25/general stress protein Ctc [Marichromatium sp.]MBK1708607.1 50S ribosomal protein L25/general stress protein Ctc [Marichromatium gracile]MCF1184119.1 50S ribosomal protein L25/general stress protein Ctc [Marichromatium gracile]RNE89210.1 50S ribosomal protein L25/general stress protein Ctc [Marichromatium sp. AB31]RNE93553.1 50S ribosomal protein L25/general stress prote
MSVDFNIVAQPRETVGKGASRRLRRAGEVPAIVYGGHQEPQMITLPHNELLKHLEHEAFYSHVLTLQVGDETSSVVLKDLQRHPAKPFILHVDFQRVTQGEKLRMSVPLHFLNEESCVGVKAGGLVSRSLTEVEVSCLPQDLPEYIEIDMVAMEVGAILHLSELQLPAGVELAHAAGDEVVVAIQAPRGGADEESEGEDSAEA